MIRRNFLAGAASLFLGSERAWPNEKKAKITNIGLQLYTVREGLGRDFERTLAAVEEIGYREVEFAGLFGHRPEDVKSILGRNGLRAPSSHVEYQSVESDWSKALDGAETLGNAFVVCPWIEPNQRRKLADWKRIADALNRAGEQSRQRGIQFAYHNHDFEFKAQEGQLPYDLILAETDPALVKMELDLYWITRAGQDPLRYLRRYPNRFALLHVKDMSSDGEIADVGSGVIDFPRIFEAAQEAGVLHQFAEHDHPKDPISSISESFRFLQQLRF